VNDPDEKFIDASPPTEVTQEQSAGQSPIASDSPSLRNTVSPSPPPTSQIPSQKEDGRSDPISPEIHGGSAGADESQGKRQDTSSRGMLQHPPPDADNNHSGSDPVSPENCDGSMRMDEGPNGTPPAGPTETSQDPSSHAHHDSPGSRTDPQDTLSSGNASRIDASDEGYGELSVRKLVFAVAEIGVGSDPNVTCGVDGNDEEQYGSNTQQDPEASGTLLVSTRPTRILHG